ncbi:hypothetical protein ANCCAN_00869 [Ancylostoma caninum]|uniref:DB module n=1 Tax=Ancylostoma caninum TaxID=29170 RepID=A0A368H8H3_ANCCA|nr:hypothetical protein ANCCAN_00869 [Ancylostoma caninum]
MNRVIFLLAFLVIPTKTEMLRQCRCQELQNCRPLTAMEILQCGDKCQRHAPSLGMSYPAFRMCLMQIGAPVESMIRCAADALSNTCAIGPPAMVPKRTVDTFKLAVLSEATTVVKRGGVGHLAQPIFKRGMPFATCHLKCMFQMATRCINKKKCGLTLPNDTELVGVLKQCMIQSDLGTVGFRRLCQCVASTGIRYSFLTTYYLSFFLSLETGGLHKFVKE